MPFRPWTLSPREWIGDWLERRWSNEGSQHEAGQAEAYDARAGDHLEEHARKNRTYERKAQLMVEEIRRRTGQNPRLLEIGCGGGFFTSLLAARMPDAQIVATDVFLPVLEAARERLRAYVNVDIRQGEPRPGDASSRFDVVLGVDVIHHLADPVRSMSGWRAIVREGGSLLFLESNPANPVLFLRSIRRREERRFFLNSPARLRRWVERAGWEAEPVEPLPFYLPSGPTSLATPFSLAEDALHLGRPLWGGLSGMFSIRGINRGAGASSDA